ncbi:MAG TPA: ABC transporter permease [Dehalococcoidia bacterium]|jgi:peptide/nickel transport system permease protein|nr:ABC transporter permease [Dehalococcoidia bacterium]
MRAYVARRLLILPALLFGISIISFALLNFAPGDPAEIILRRQNPEEPPLPEAVRALRQQLGLDAPLPLRYGRWLFDVLKGDLGESYRSGTPIMSELVKRFPATMMLATAALALSVVVSIPLGIIAALWRGSLLDSLSRLLALLGAAVPSYVLALLLMLFIAVKLNWLPAIGYGSPKNLILPAIALAAGSSAQVMRLTRASMLEVLQQDYMRTARSKGLNERTVVMVHGLKNGLLPVVTMLGINLGHLLGGTVIVETIFGWPGVGRYAVESILQRDYPVVQGFVLYMALIFLLANLAVDFSYRWLDPRLHFGRQPA